RRDLISARVVGGEGRVQQRRRVRRDVGHRVRRSGGQGHRVIGRQLIAPSLGKDRDLTLQDDNCFAARMRVGRKRDLGVEAGQGGGQPPGAQGAGGEQANLHAWSQVDRGGTVRSGQHFQSTHGGSPDGKDGCSSGGSGSSKATPAAGRNRNPA